MTFDPNKHKDSYDPKKQEKENAGFWLPETGTYAVVNTHLQFMWVGQKQTKKCRVRAHVLEVIESEEHDVKKLADSVGKSFPVDLWWDLSKKKNAKMLAHLCTANRCEEAFDPDDKKALVSAVTGAPYAIKLKKETRSFTNGKSEKVDRDELRVLFFSHLPDNRVKKYTKLPDWDAVVGEPDERFLEDRKIEPRGRSGSGGEGGDSDPFKDPEPEGDGFHDDDLPF